MKTDIHPKYYPAAIIKCACGNTLEVGSTTEEMHIELCNNCHPFYTGQQKLVDTARRVDKFQKRAEAQTVLGGARRGRRIKLAARSAKRQIKIDESKKIASKHKLVSA